MFVIIGGLIPTFLISRLLFLVTRKWDTRFKKVFLNNFVSLLICTLLGAMGMADGGAFAAVMAFSIYLIPQMVWLLVDLWRYRKK